MRGGPIKTNSGMVGAMTDARSARDAALRRLRASRILGRSLCLSFFILPAACQHAPPRPPPFLPSHPPGEMFPRASSPPPECPGQYRTMIEDAGGNIFLGCWGQRTD